MEKDVIMWIVGSLEAIMLPAIGWLITSHIGMLQSIATLQADARSVKELIEMVGIKVAMRLHSPHTPEYDALAEKFEKNNGVLDPKDWDRMRQLCSDLESDETEPGEKRAMASVMEAVARHKLQDLMKLPPRTLRKHTD